MNFMEINKEFCENYQKNLKKFSASFQNYNFWINETSRKLWKNLEILNFEKIVRS